MSIDVQRAVAVATEYLQALFPGDAEDVLLEEVELDSTKSQWLVTLSFFRRGEVLTGPLVDFMGTRRARRYKIFRIDATSGTVFSMKIRPTEK